MHYVPYFLDQTPPSNSCHTQIVAVSFTYLNFIVAALELSAHILIRAHLPSPLKRCPRACSEWRYCKYCTRSGHVCESKEILWCCIQASNSGDIELETKFFIFILSYTVMIFVAPTIQPAVHAKNTVWSSLFTVQHTMGD